MSFEVDSAIALVGVVLFLAGIYLWLGLAATFILAGLALIYIGARLELPKKSAQPATQPKEQEA